MIVNGISLTSNPLHQHGVTWIPAWISDYIHYKVWDEITYSFPNFNSCTVEVWEWISNFTPHFTGHVITYLWDYSKSMLVKGAPGDIVQYGRQYVTSLSIQLINVSEWDPRRHCSIKPTICNKKQNQKQTLFSIRHRIFYYRAHNVYKSNFLLV